MLTKQDLASLLYNELSRAEGFSSDVLATKRANALDYYQGLSPAVPTTIDPTTGQTVQTRSGIVSMDLADCLHSLMAQIEPIVKTTSIEFEPDSEQDEPQAQAESDMVRKFMEREGGYDAVFNACHDAFMSANGWFAIEVEDKEETIEQCYPPNLPDEAIAFLSQPAKDGETREVEVEDDETCVYITNKVKKLVFRSVPPEDMVFSNTYGIKSIEELRLVAERRQFTESQLRKMDISQDIIDRIPDSPADYNSGGRARQGIYQNETSDNQALQDAEQLKEVFCCYFRVDMNDSGKSELRNIWIGGREIIYDDSSAFVPYVSGCAIPMPHRIEGLSLYELLASIQDGKTHVLRSFMDNLTALNGSRVGAVEGQVNMNDLTNGRINGIVRMKRPDAIVPLPSADIGPQAMAGLQYLDQVRTQRVGSALDFNEAQAQVMGSSATAAAGQLAKVEQMAGWFATNLVQTLLKPAFSMVHRIMREEMGGPVSGKLRGQWVQMDSRQWPVRNNITITLGMTTAERAAKVGALGQLISHQANIIQQGGKDILVTFANFYNAMADWIRANRLGSPDEYLLDPTSEQSQQALASGQKAQEDQKAHIEQLQIQLTQMGHQFELQKQENDLKWKYYDTNMKAEVDEAKMTVDGTIEMKKIEAGVVSNAIGLNDKKTD